MQRHEINLARQHNANRTYLRNLDGFISSPRFSQLTKPHQEAMLWQRDSMLELDNALTHRMQLLDLPVNN